MVRFILRFNFLWIIFLNVSLLVDLSKAGLSKFKVWVETPNGSNLPIVFDSNYSKKIGIIPKEIGKCLVFMKLGDALIKGVPLEITAIKA